MRLRMREFSIKSINVLFFLTIGLALFICLFLSKRFYVCKRKFDYPNMLNLAIGVSIYIVFILIIYTVNKFNRKNYNTDKIMLGMTVVLTGAVFYLGIHYCFSAGWDSGVIMKNASYISSGQRELLSNEYYSWYPNNILLTSIFAILMKISAYLGINTGYYLILIYQCIIYALTGYLVYACVNMLLSRNYGLTAWCIYVLLVGLSPWVVVPYSDSTALFLVMLNVFCFFKIYKREHLEFFLFAFVMISVLGYMIKPQVFILTIAVFLVCLTRISMVWIRNWKKLILRIGVMLLAGLTAFGVYGGAEKYCGFELEEECKLGMFHFMMMGLNEDRDGVWAAEDVTFSQSYLDSDERRNANIEEIKHRIKTLGSKGLAALWINKTLNNYNDGTFAWGVEGGFYGDSLARGNAGVIEFMENLFCAGKYQHYYEGLVQALWLATLLLGIFSFWKNRDLRVSALMLAIVGLSLFELIFEARARYLFAYAPVYIILAMLGANNLQRYYRKNQTG